MNHWLFKSEPDTFGIEDLARVKRSGWEGVRNYQARNFLRDGVKKGDEVFFYHSSCEVPGIAGIASVVKAGYPDPTALNPKSEYFDERSEASEPTWYTVDLRFVRRMKRIIPLEELRAHAQGKLSDLQLLQRGNRLSVMPVSERDWRFILSLE